MAVPMLLYGLEDVEEWLKIDKAAQIKYLMEIKWCTRAETNGETVYNE